MENFCNFSRLYHVSFLISKIYWTCYVQKLAFVAETGGNSDKIWDMVIVCNFSTSRLNYTETAKMWATSALSRLHPVIFFLISKFMGLATLKHLICCRNSWEFLQDLREDNSEIHGHWWTKNGRPTGGIEHGSGLVRWPLMCSFYPIRTWQFDFGVHIYFLIFTRICSCMIVRRNMTRHFWLLPD